MDNFLIALSDVLNQVVQFVEDTFTYFNNLYTSLTNSIEFVMECIDYIPSSVSVVASIVLGIMIVKFVLSLGKQ